jgi:hypothetical protein
VVAHYPATSRGPQSADGGSSGDDLERVSSSTGAVVFQREKLKGVSVTAAPVEWTS